MALYEGLGYRYLHGVSDEGGRPSLGEAAHALLGHGHAEAVHHILVLVCVHLQPALHQVERHHRRVRDTCTTSLLLSDYAIVHTRGRKLLLLIVR